MYLKMSVVVGVMVNQEKLLRLIDLKILMRQIVIN